MNNSRIRVIGSVICSLIIVTSFAGCKKNTVNTDNSETSKEALTIKMVNRVAAGYILENNPVIKAIEEKANVKLDIEIPPVSDYTNRMNIIMASGDLPDLMHLQNMDSNYQKYAEEGLIIALDDYLKDTPNINRRMQKDQLEQARSEKTGKLHSIPRPAENATRIALYRKDWFDTLKLNAPETIEDFKKVALAIAKGDPDKNGKDDTYFMSILPGAEVEPLLSSVFGIRGVLVPDSKGKVTITEAQEGYIKLLDFYKDLYTEKALDQEWFLNKTYGDRDKFKQGKVAMITNNNKPNELVGATAKDLLKAFPEAKIDYFLPLKNTEGKRVAYLRPSIWGGYAISNTAKNPKGIMKFIDWCFSDEGIEIFTAGVKGVTYESFDLKTGINKVTGSMVDANAKYISTYMSFINAIDGKSVIVAGNTDEERKVVSEATEKYYKQMEIVNDTPTSFVSGFIDASAKLTDINNSKNQYITKYITGQISKDEFTKFVNEKFIPANKEVIDSLQKYYDSKLKK